jgi:extracellular factor (EF) 3-hydroxypalmitic acid methyl ester biosynthesis protein
MSPTIDRIHSALDAAEEMILDGAVSEGMTVLHRDLEEARRSCPPEQWHPSCRTVFDGHAMRRIVHQSPFAERAYTKPRGYAGDAVTMDFAYQVQPMPSGTTGLGRAIYEWEAGAQSCVSVRSRRDLCAEYLDDSINRSASPRILSVACGHLREAAHSQALTRGKVKQLLAFDHDAASLAAVSSMYPEGVVQTICGSVRDILAGKACFSGLDLIYSAGLYDYLPDSVAARLTARLFEFLNPGGKLLIVNFTPELTDIGCLETCMDWRLIYRTEADMTRIARRISSHSRSAERCFRFACGALVAWEATKAD